MNFLIFIFSYIDIQPEYNLLSFILSAQSKLNIGRLSNINNISIRVKTSRNQAGWSGLVVRLVLGKIVSLSFQWPGEPHSQAGNVCFAWKVRSLSWADLLVRVWRSAGFYCILTCNDGVMGKWEVGPTSYHFISNVKYSWFRQQDHYFYLIVPRSESH